MNFFKSTLFVMATAAIGVSACAQDAEKPEESLPPAAFPETEIFLFDYSALSAEDALSNGKNVTNRPGYDNQPYFTKNSDSFVYSRDDGVQTDVWEYDLAGNTHHQITDNDKSEFSPTPSPDNSRPSI